MIRQAGTAIAGESARFRGAVVIRSGRSVSRWWAAMLLACCSVQATDAAEGAPDDSARRPEGPRGASVVMALTASSTVAALHDALLQDLRGWIMQGRDTLRCRGYVLSLRIPDLDIDGFGVNRGWAPAPHALIQYAFDDEATAREASTSAAGLLPPSVIGTMDTGKSSIFVAVETTVFSTLSDVDRWDVQRGDGPVKMVVQNWRRPDLGFEAYTRHWRTEHARLVREYGPDMGFRRYVQSHRIDAPNGSEPVEGWAPSPDGGITEVWWRSHADMKRDLVSAGAQSASALFAEDEKNFVFAPRMSAFLAREIREHFDDAADSRRGTPTGLDERVPRHVP